MQRSSARTSDHSKIFVLRASLRAQSATFDTQPTDSPDWSDPDEPQAQAELVVGSCCDLLEALQQVVDPRKRRGIRHQLVSILALVSADALHTQRAHARFLVEDKNADYLLVAKENQPGLCAHPQWLANLASVRMCGAVPVSARARASVDVDMDQLLRHHGDVDAAPGLLDFAVNVRREGLPGWLRERLITVMDGLAHYPSAAQDATARAAVAARHGRGPDEVLVLGGVAEGFALLPALASRAAVVVHPSFTEPEVALRRAGIPVHRVFTDLVYQLRPERVPAEADLVVLGNPTNPTSVLHPAEVVRALARPGRVLVVDEAFADAVPGEQESLAADRNTPGLLVFRSLTKTWALPGLRAGYALGAPDLLTRLAAPRPPWPVGSLVLEAVRACSSPAAVAEAAAVAAQIAQHREWLVRQLAELPGVTVHQPAAAPFLLLRVPGGERVRALLADAGIAVRRADTFPGLTADHLRVAVRPPEIAVALVDGLRVALGVS